MIRKKKNLIPNYTDQDLQSFTILENFKSYRSDSTETKNKKNINQSVRYAPSDNEHFQKIINNNKNTDTSSERYFNNNFTKSDDLVSTKTNKYNELDTENFDKLKQFPFSNSSYSPNYTNKKEDSASLTIDYTDSDLEEFDRIIKNNKNKTTSQPIKKNVEQNDLKLKNDQSSIKIMDFNKVKRREKINSNQRVKKIKVVYFD